MRLPLSIVIDLEHGLCTRSSAMILAPLATSVPPPTITSNQHVGTQIPVENICMYVINSSVCMFS